MNDIPRVHCSCRRVVCEIDTIFCEDCGDVACHDCAVDCVHCQKVCCLNCAENNAECIKCHLNPQGKEEDFAFLVIDGEITPIKNSEYMIEKTDTLSARDIKLILDNVEYKFNYRTINKRISGSGLDYFIHFEEIATSPSPYTQEDFELAYQEYERTGFPCY